MFVFLASVTTVVLATSPDVQVKSQSEVANGDSLIAIGNTPNYAILQSTNDLLARLNPGEVKLRWIAPGDDGNAGRATGYDMRYVPASRGAINTQSRWNSATRVDGEPTPSMAGRLDSMIISHLIPGASYYFCIKAFDDVGNYSGLSNSPQVTARDTNFVPGDANGDSVCNGSDVSYLVAFFKGFAPAPIPLLAADANGDCSVASSDVTYLVRYFKGVGSPPVRGSCGLLGKIAMKTFPTEH